MIRPLSALVVLAVVLAVSAIASACGGGSVPIPCRRTDDPASPSPDPAGGRRRRRPTLACSPFTPGSVTGEDSHVPVPRPPAGPRAGIGGKGRACGIAGPAGTPGIGIMNCTPIAANSPTAINAGTGSILSRSDDIRNGEVNSNIHR